MRAEVESTEPLPEEINVPIINVDDHEPMRFFRTRVLTNEGYEVVEADSVATGHRRSTDPGAELTLLDLRLPDGTGFDLCERLKEERPSLPVVLISNTYRSTQWRLDGLAAGADAFLTEPVEPEDLVRCIRGYIGHLPSGGADATTAWVLTTPEGVIDNLSGGAARVLNRSPRSACGSTLLHYFEDREAARQLLAAARAGQFGRRTLVLRPRELKPVTITVNVTGVSMPGDRLNWARWAFSLEKPLPRRRPRGRQTAANRGAA